MPPLTPNGTVTGTPGNDTIDAAFVDAQGDRIDDPTQVFPGRGPLDDLISAGEGNDLVLAGAGDDTVFGGPGNDTLNGGDGDDVLFGGAGDDVLIGNGGNNLMVGGGPNAPGEAEVLDAGDNTFVGGQGNDTMIGGNGDDTFLLGTLYGNHVIDGGGNRVFGDRIIVEPPVDNTVTFTGDGTGTISRGPGSEVNFTGIERIDLTGGDDLVQVIAPTNGIIAAGQGSDTLVIEGLNEGGPDAPIVTLTETRNNPDGTQSFFGFVDFADGSRLEFKNFETIICFTPGARIDTARGPVAVEALVPGDRVLTRDHGFRPLVWCGRRDLPGAAVARWPDLAPVRIAAGALGAGVPARDLVVSPGHRMLLTGARAEVLFGEREVLAAAVDLLGLPGITRAAPGAVSYLHIMCEGHEVIRAEGAWTESFQPSAGILDGMAEAARAEILRLFPELATPSGQTRLAAAARPVLSPAEVRLLVA